MTQEEKREEKFHLRCEKVVNETWSDAEKYTEEIEKTLKKEEWDERDQSLMRIAAAAFCQRAIMDKADSIALFGVDLYKTSPCGLESKEDCPCDRKVCIFSIKSS